MRDTHIYVGNSHRQRKTNKQFIRKVWRPSNYSRLHSIKFPRFVYRKILQKGTQLVTKESEGASTRTLIVLYKLNNAHSQKLPAVLMKSKLRNEIDTGWEK